MPDPTGDHTRMLVVTTYNPTTGYETSITCATGSDTHNLLLERARTGDLELVQIVPAPTGADLTSASGAN